MCFLKNCIFPFYVFFGERVSSRVGSSKQKKLLNFQKVEISCLKQF